MGCYKQPWNEGLCLVLLYIPTLYSIDILGRLRGNGAKVDSDVGEQGMTGRSGGRGNIGQDAFYEKNK